MSEGSLSDPPARDELGRALRRLIRATERLELGALAATGLPRVQAHALLAVAGMARPAMAMVARELGLAPSTVTRLLEPLVERGLLRREADPGDRRVVVVALTPAGRQMVRRVAAELAAAYSRVAAAAGAGGRRRLLLAARELSEALERVAAIEPKSRRAGHRARPPKGSFAIAR